MTSTEIEWLQYAPVTLDGNVWIGDHVAYHDDYELKVTRRSPTAPWEWSVKHAFDDTDRQGGTVEGDLDAAKAAATAALSRMLAAGLAFDEDQRRRRRRP